MRERARKGLGIESLMLHLPSTHSITCLLFLRWWWWWWWWRGWRWGWQSSPIYSHCIIPLHFLFSSPKIHSNLFSFLRETSLLVPDGARDSRRVRLRARDSLRCPGRAKAQCHLVRILIHFISLNYQFPKETLLLIPFTSLLPHLPLPPC